jgi:hypothetical protein
MVPRLSRVVEDLRFVGLSRAGADDRLERLIREVRSGDELVEGVDVGLLMLSVMESDRAPRSSAQGHPRHKAAAEGKAPERRRRVARARRYLMTLRRTFSSCDLLDSVPQDGFAANPLSLLEILDFPLMLLCRLERIERTEITAPTGLRFLLDREEPILA